MPSLRAMLSAPAAASPRSPGWGRALALSLGCVLGLVLALPAPAAAQGRLADDLVRLASWFGGEWNNHEQVWQQKIDIANPRLSLKPELSEHLHHIFAPVVAPAIGEQIFYVQQSAGTELGKPYRQRIYRFSVDEAAAAVKLEIFRLKDEKAWLDGQRKPERFASLTPQDLTPIPGCEVWWRFDAARQSFAGTMLPDACRFVSPRSGQRLTVNDTLELRADQIWINDQARDDSGQLVFGSKTGVPSKNRKVRYFEGWIWIKHAGPAAAFEDRKASFTRRVQLHNEGQRLPILYDDGTASPYLLELALLTYQNTQLPILKFALLDAATGKSVSYIWTNTEATRIGMNLSWFQSGLTQKKERMNFGF